jgi:mannose-6-phosphate isomerase-like protein (cupin superfamily)
VDRTKPPNIFSVLSDISDHWSPQTIAVLNDYDDRLAKVGGEFSPHSHPETDEFFLVLSGSLTISMDYSEVTLHQGDTFVVPRGRVHQPNAV